MKSYSGLSAQARQQMRASLTKQQAKASTAKHDSRNFDVENSQHIDQDRVDEDEFYTWLDTDEYKCTDFNEAMLKFYEETYSDTLKRINDNYIKDRHPKKADKNTMDVYLANHMPEAFILQIGNCMDNVDADKLMDCVQDYLAWEDEWNEEHGRPFEILTMALHVDEATPHIHGTRAWKAKDKHGNIIPNREKALEQAGVELPKPDKKVSRCNNRNVTFTAMCRDKWLDICEEHGFNIIREPIRDVKHQNKGNYIREREKAAEERSKALEAQQKQQQQVTQRLLEAEIEQNQKDYAIESISFVLDERENMLNERESKLDDKEVEIAEKVMTAKDLRDDAVGYCKEAQKYVNMGDNYRASLMAEFMQGCSMNGKSAYDVFCEREPQLKAARAKADYELQQKIDEAMNRIKSINHDCDFER